MVNSFYSKIKDSGRRRTTRSSSSRFGVRITALLKFFTIYPSRFSTPEISEILRCFLLLKLWEICETRNFRRKILILPPPLLSIYSLATGGILKHSTEGFPYESFWHCETKIFQKESWYSPPSYPKTLLLPEIFRNTAQNGSPTKIFGTVRQKTFDGKSWHNPLKHKNLRYPKLMTTKRFPYGIFRHCETKNFRGKILILPPSQP